MPCNKIDKPLVVYRFTGNVMTSIITLHKINIDYYTVFFYPSPDLSPSRPYQPEPEGRGLIRSEG